MGKNNRGSLTIIAIFTILIFSLYGILLYARSASSYIRQTKLIETIQAAYAYDVPNATLIAQQLGGVAIEDDDGRDTLRKRIADDELFVGDYIYYDPDSTNSYSTTVAEAGYVNNLTPSSGIGKIWRVWSISSGKIAIVPSASYTNATLKLKDVQGFVNGAKIINDACKALFTNSSLGVGSADIRSLKIEDINAVYNGNSGVPLHANLKHLYYQGTPATPSPEKVAEGYVAVSHSGAEGYPGNQGYRKFFFPKDVDGNTISGFADMEGGTPGTTNGMNYLAISSGNPIYVKETFKSSSSSSWNTIGGMGRNKDVTYGSMLVDNGWLASPFISMYISTNDDDNIRCGIQRILSNGVDGNGIYHSSGYVNDPSNPLCPLVELSTSLPVLGGNGTQASPYDLQDIET